MVRGIETQAKALAAARLRDNVVASFDDHSLRLFSCDSLEKMGKYEL